MNGSQKKAVQMTSHQELAVCKQTYMHEVFRKFELTFFRYGKGYGTPGLDSIRKPSGMLVPWLRAKLLLTQWLRHCVLFVYSTPMRIFRLLLITHNSCRTSLKLWITFLHKNCSFLYIILLISSTLCADVRTAQQLCDELHFDTTENPILWRLRCRTINWEHVGGDSQWFGPLGECQYNS